MDALSAIVTLLKPQAVGAKIIRGAGRWGVRYEPFNQPGFALVLSGGCHLAADGIPAMQLEAGDFVLFPSTPGFTMASEAKVKPRATAPVRSDDVEEIFHGDETLEPSVTMLGGYFTVDPINASMLLDFLPKMLRVRASDPASGSIAAVVDLIQREAREKRVGRALVLTRLIEVMLVEALRCAPADFVTTGLLAGLRDPQLAIALRGIHTRTVHRWSLASLAREAAMSRSSFAERFSRVIGMTPLNYLLQWRLAVAKDLLAREEKTVAETALAVGYVSASGFSTSFSREVGRAPKEFIGAHQRSA